MCQYSNIQLIAKNSFQEVSCAKKHYEIRQMERIAKKEAKKSYMGTLGIVLEKVVQEWLKITLPITEHSVLYYNENRGNCFYSKKHELDAIIGTVQKPQKIVEVKVTASTKAVEKGAKQVHRNTKIAKARWKGVQSQLIVLNLFPEKALLDVSPFSLECNEVMIQHIDNYTEVDILNLDAIDFWNWGIKNNIIKDSYLLHRALDELAEDKRSAILGVKKEEQKPIFKTFGCEKQEESPFSVLQNLLSA